PAIPDWAMAAFIMVAILKQRKSKSSQYRFLCSHRQQLLSIMRIKQFPARSTYFDRYRRAHRLYEHAIRIQSEWAIDQGLVNPRCVAVDKSIVKSRGKPWYKSDRTRGEVPPQTDTEAGWTKTRTGWHYGFTFEAVVSAEKTGAVWP